MIFSPAISATAQKKVISTFGISARVPTRPSRIPHFFSLKRGESMAAILSRPYSVFVEISGHDQLESLLNSILHKNSEIILSITTATCYKNDIALCFADILSERMGLAAEKTSDIATCLQEAIANAILHGNLGVSSEFDTMHDFDEYQAKIDQHLQQDEYKYKRIHISAWDGHSRLKIAVSDEGNGFDLSRNLLAPDKHLAHGRGLLFIKAMTEDMWLSEDKRTLFMTFAC